MKSESEASGGRVGHDAEAIERTYGDCAPVYAEVRAEAAAKRGAGADAEHWQDVEDNLRAEQGYEGCA